jgi:hypothetical protein
VSQGGGDKMVAILIPESQSPTAAQSEEFPVWRHELHGITDATNRWMDAQTGRNQ